MNAIYSFFRIRPTEDDLEKSRLGRILIQDGNLKILENYHNVFSHLIPGKVTGPTKEALRRLMDSPYIEAREWDDHLGDQEPADFPEASLEELVTPQTELLPDRQPSVFEYMRVGMDAPHIVEANGDQLLLDGRVLSPAESKTLLTNVTNGVATLRYHRPGGPYATPNIPGTKGYLGKSESPTKLNIKKDLMAPKLGNLHALAERIISKDTFIVVVLDINDFEKANEIGWREADEAMVAFSDLIAKNSKDAYRAVSDLFVMFFDTIQDAYVFLRDLSIQEKELPPVGGDYHITFSAGVGQTLAEAHRALWKAQAIRANDNDDSIQTYKEQSQ